MANRLLSKDEIRAQLELLDDISGKEAGYDIGDLEITRKIDGKSVRYQTTDLLMPIHEFSRRILWPLISQKREPVATFGIEVGPSPRPSTILDERGKTHGDYTYMSTTIQAIKNVMRGGVSWDAMQPTQKEALDLIATKIGRIVCGDPNCHDHWTDIVGYATLALQRIAHKPKG